MALPTLAEVKAALPNTSAADDALLTMFLDSAIELVEALVGAVRVRTITEDHSYTYGPVRLRETPILSVLTVNGQAVSSNDAPPDLTGLLPHATGVITYTVGRNPVPAPISLAVLYTVQHAWESQRGAVPVAFQSGADETFTTSRGFFVPNRAKELLRPYMYRGQVA